MGRTWDWWRAAHLTRTERRREAVQGLAVGVVLIVAMRIVAAIV
jgi:hypothetical protein